MRQSTRARLALLLPLTATIGLTGEPIPAQPPNVDAVHDELRALRDAMLDAWMRRDLDALLTHVDPDVVVTWQNGEVNRGHEGIRRFYTEVLGGEDSIIERIESMLEMAELSVLHGEDSAVAFGTIRDTITFNRAAAGAPFIGAGTDIALESRWTAALARKNGRWQLTAYHVSANIFSNPVLSLAMTAVRWIAALAGFAAGVVLTLVVMRLYSASRKRRASAA